ncbi:4-hydroxyproline epimerase [Candidatus Pantoea multigeneris]|uniref:4-hydroxyproline epimerase n=1 Tax=Candidatus Pantoea multigeneris TaxID=2608357 RepID=A0ABX0R980_9GAMM|nr:4-hydroxyproline epimerase [Pantoea multigeneris]NIF20009.1 4-hydroxyproline epimerase [Pantoea multigeneris]
MARYNFECIEGHTAGMPVRLIISGQPELEGATQSDRRRDFIERFDWMRTGIMCEPRGHEMMSGAMLVPSTRPDCDTGVLYLETSGCIPMCGHATVGLTTFVIENALITPQTPGVLRLDTPAGVVEAHYVFDGTKVTEVRFVNIPSFVFAKDVEIDHPDLGRIHFDIAYGGNFYPIVESQANYRDCADYSPEELRRMAQVLVKLIPQVIDVVHPEDPNVRGVHHTMWGGAPQVGGDARGVVIATPKIIDRSPCGTGTSARVALRAARGLQDIGDVFVHESIIGTTFKGRVEEHLTLRNGTPAVRPSVEGVAYVTGRSSHFIDDEQPFYSGFLA